MSVTIPKLDLERTSLDRTSVAHAPNSNNNSFVSRFGGSPQLSPILSLDRRSVGKSSVVRTAMTKMSPRHSACMASAASSSMSVSKSGSSGSSAKPDTEVNGKSKARKSAAAAANASNVSTSQVSESLPLSADAKKQIQSRQARAV